MAFESSKGSGGPHLLNHFTQPQPHHSHVIMSQFSLDAFKPSNLFDLTGRVAIVTGGATGE